AAAVPPAAAVVHHARHRVQADAVPERRRPWARLMSELGPPEGTPPGVRDLLIEVTLNPATADLILRRLDAHQFVLISSADLDDIARNGTARRIVDAYWPA